MQRGRTGQSTLLLVHWGPAGLLAVAVAKAERRYHVFSHWRSDFWSLPSGLSAWRERSNGVRSFGESVSVKKGASLRSPRFAGGNFRLQAGGARSIAEASVACVMPRGRIHKARLPLSSASRSPPSQWPEEGSFRYHPVVVGNRTPETWLKAERASKTRYPTSMGGTFPGYPSRPRDAGNFFQESGERSQKSSSGRTPGSQLRTLIS